MRSSSATDARRPRDTFARLTDGGRVRHQPGLDGLRGLAVAAVVVFHTGLGWLPGGYLGVSLFFTISGTVIGTVILHEIDHRGAFSLRSFWTRRARRLLPAAWVLLTVIAVLRVTSTVFSSTSGGDLVASWLQVANWHLLAADSSYAELFGGPSAVLHFWSLAIEEQFYLAIGAAAVVLARRSSRPAQHLAIGAAVLAALSFALPTVLGLGVDRTYYGTDTRAGELLAGLVIAGIIADPSRRRRMLATRRALAAAAVAALAVAVVLWRSLDASDPALRTWVLPVSALISCALVTGALLPGPLHVLVTRRPLRRLGDISYALYLVHWPVFIVLRHNDPDPGPLAFAAAIAIAVVLAALSTWLVEAPVRSRRVPRVWLTAVGAALTGCALVAVTLPVQRSDADELLHQIEQAAGSGAEPAPTRTRPVAGPGTPAVPPAPAATTSTTTGDAAAPAPHPAPAPTRSTPAELPTVGFAGDSIALSLAMGMGHAADDARFTLTGGVYELGCGIALSPDPDAGHAAKCASLVDRMAAQARELDLDAVVVVSCQWELLEQPLPGTSDRHTIGDPAFDDYVREQFRRTAEKLRAAGVGQVMWLRCPRQSLTVGREGGEMGAARGPERVAALNAIVDDLAADDVIDVVDLGPWVEPRVDDASLRADGSHFVFDDDTGVAGELTRLINDALDSAG